MQSWAASRAGFVAKTNERPEYRRSPRRRIPPTLDAWNSSFARRNVTETIFDHERCASVPARMTERAPEHNARLEGRQSDLLIERVQLPIARDGVAGGASP